MGLLPFLKYLFNDVPLDYQGPEQGWYVVPNFTRFTQQPSLDFRLHAVAGGFVAAWSDFLSCRDLAGRPRWRLDGPGHCVSVHPQGHELLACAATTDECLRLEASTGRVLERFVLPPAPNEEYFYPQQLHWLPDGRVLAMRWNWLGVLSPDRRSWQLCTTVPRVDAPTEPELLSGLCWQPAHPDEVLLVAGAYVLRLDLHTGAVRQRAAFDWPTLLPGPRAAQPLLCLHQELVLLNPADLSVAARYPFEGLEGVRTEAENQHQQSATLWPKRALLSPGGKYLLAVDHSGLVWLFDAKTRYQLRIFRRELLDHAFDVCWLDEKNFVALLNHGRVARIDVTQPQGVFEVLDFSPEDEARFRPDADEIAAQERAASTPEQLRAALDTLAATPDPAAYVAAWQTLHYAPAGLSWQAQVTPAHVTGALRQYTWYLPTAGFRGLEVFEQMRRQLTAVQYYLPQAPVAPVLDFHDAVLLRHDYDPQDPDSYWQQLEYRLRQAYEDLHDWLYQHNPEDEEGRCFLDTPAYDAFLAANQQVLAFLDIIDHRYAYEAHNLLEYVLPQYLAQYESFVRQQPPGAQVRLLAPAAYHDHPAVIELMRRFRDQSPYPAVRAYAAHVLTDAGH